MQEGEDFSPNVLAEIQNLEASADLPKILHALANKLLPIVTFSDLGIRNARDPVLLNYFQKIRHAADEARDLIVGLRLEFQERERRMKLENQDFPRSAASRRSIDTKGKFGP